MLGGGGPLNPVQAVNAMSQHSSATMEFKQWQPRQVPTRTSHQTQHQQPQLPEGAQAAPPPRPHTPNRFPQIQQSQVQQTPVIHPGYMVPIGDFTWNLNALLEQHSARLAAHSASQFLEIRSQLSSITESCKGLKQDILSVQNDTQHLLETHKRDQAATTKVLKDLADKADTLEARLGESQLGHPNRLMMDRMDEISLTLRDIASKFNDMEARPSTRSSACPAELGLPRIPPKSRSVTVSQHPTPRMSPPPRPGFRSQGNQGVSGELGCATQVAIPSNDTEMGDSTAAPQGAIPASTQAQGSSDTFFTPSSRLGVNSTIRTNQFNPESSVSLESERQAADQVLGFSRVDWTQAEQGSPSLSRTHNSPRSSPWCASAALHSMNHTSLPNGATDKTPYRPSPLVHVDRASREPHEPQQLPSPMDLIPPSRQPSQSRTSQPIHRTPSESFVQELLEPAPPSSQPFTQSSSQAPYHTPEESFTHPAPSQAPPHPLSTPVDPQPQPERDILPPSIKRQPSPRHVETAPARTLYDKRSPAKMPIPASPLPPLLSPPTHVGTTFSAPLAQDQEVSPEMSLSALPELGYPTRESTVVPEGNIEEEVGATKEDTGMEVDKDLEAEVDPVKPASCPPASDGTDADDEGEEEDEEEEGEEDDDEEEETAAPTSRVEGEAKHKNVLEVATKQPLFLPDSMSPYPAGMMGSDTQLTIKDEASTEAHSPLLSSQNTGDREENEEDKTPLPLPAPSVGSPRIDSSQPSPLGSSIYASPPVNPTRLITTSTRFSPPETPPSQLSQLLDVSPDGPALEYASLAASPAPPTSPIRQIPIIDVSQLIPSQESQVSPLRGISYHPPPSQSHSAASTATQVSNQTTSSQEVAHLLTTLSEPESSDDGEDNEDDDEEENEDQLVDELFHSVTPCPQEESFESIETVGEQTFATSSSIQTFSAPQEKDSIQSFGVVEPLAPAGDIAAEDLPMGDAEEVEQDQIHADVDQPMLEPQDDTESPAPPSLRYQPQTESLPVQEPPPQPEPQSVPQVEITPPETDHRREDDHPMQSTPDTRSNRSEKRKPATPIQLPLTLSPVNSPSGTPLPSIFSLAGRKRKLDELKERRKSKQFQDTGKDGKDGNSTPRACPSKSGRPVPPPSQAQSEDPTKISSAVRSGPTGSMSHPRRSGNAEGREGESEKQTRRGSKVSEREGSPIYISSTPNSPEMRDAKALDKDGVECIDLTETVEPPLKKSKPGTKEKENIKEKDKEKKSAAPTKSRAQQAREKKIEQQQKEKGAAEAREKERKKRREEERKKMPLGADMGDDSDEPDVRPAHKIRKAQLPPSCDDEDEAANRAPRPTQGPSVNFRALASKHDENAKNSKAMTRIKRRDKPISNASSTDMPSDQQTPLGKARSRGASGSGPTTSAAGPSDKRKRKEQLVTTRDILGLVDLTTEAPSSPTRTKWPAKRDSTRHDKNCIECDSCHTWYHNGCVGIQVDDVRMNDEEIFVCPPCMAGRDPGSSEGSDGTCGRPDCTITALNASGEFFVKRLVGRRVRVEGGKGRVEEYLVEWDSYPLGEATWEREESMVDPNTLIQAFVQAAEEEGLDIDANPSKTILLSDARRIGWTSDEE